MFWTVSNPKTKHMVTGRLVQESDKEPISVEGGEICGVSLFRLSYCWTDTDVQRASPTNNNGLTTSPWQRSGEGGETKRR